MLSSGRSSGGSAPNPSRSMYFCIVEPPSFSPTSAQTVLTEPVSAAVRRDVAVARAAEVAQRPPGDDLGAATADGRRRAVATAVDRRDRRHDLERRAGRIARLGRIVEVARVPPPGRGATPALGSNARCRRHHLDRPGARIERHDRARAAGQLGERDPLRLGIQRRENVVALLLAAGQLVDDRSEGLGPAGEVVVARALELGLVVVDVVVADRMAEQVARRVACARRSRRGGPIGPGPCCRRL